MDIKIEFDTKELRRMTSKELAKQIDYGMMKGLNDTAFAIMRAERAHIKQELNLTRQFLPQSIVVSEKATRNRHTATISFLPRAWFANLLEDGGNRNPKSSRYLAVPTTNVKRTKRGAVSKANRAGSLGAKSDTFIADLNGRGPAMWQRLPGRRLKLLYVLEDQTTYDPNQIKFIRVAKSNATKYLSKNIARQIDLALRSAK